MRSLYYGGLYCCRWGSTYEMVRGILLLENAVIGAARQNTELREKLPTNKQWRILKDLIVLLKPYAMVRDMPLNVAHASIL